MICEDLRENRKRWWKVRSTNQPAAQMSTSAFPVLSWAAEHPKRRHDFGKLPETFGSILLTLAYFRSSAPGRFLLQFGLIVINSGTNESF